ncbi:MAG: helix-hairpin-helix domain-containing protein [Bacteroidota bacterium]|nr:helix-hairpin-helix domain-containing protein [Bacteroidota bacterium]
MQQLSNRDIADVISETAKLMELHNVNEFKLKSLQNAAFVISRLEVPLSNVAPGELEMIKGIGKSISQKILQILQTGTLDELETYLKDTPGGVVEMMRIKGIGPKKVAVLWKQLGVESPGELLYACNENRLIELKGFGSKTQEQIRKAIEYRISSKGSFHFAALEHPAREILEALKNSDLFSKAELTGAIRRKCEVLQQIEIIAGRNNSVTATTQIELLELFKNFQLVKANAPTDSDNESESFTEFIFTANEGVVINIKVVKEIDFYKNLFLTTGNADHMQQLKMLEGFDQINKGSFENEEHLFQLMGLSYIEPELREGLDEIALAAKNSLPELVKFEDLRGCLHNHSTYSDGLHSLKEMAQACRESGYSYLGICDHSKSAFYANGLSVERVMQQHLEIDQLNREMAPFKIFKGIESDILHDGSLDYPDHILQQFDFIVASVHSGLKMNSEKATARLLAAIANPYTTILGHPTGRLLLAREGYPIDHKAVIDACAEYNVVIELNAHPYRLDIDWRWIRYAISKNVMIAVNPDAHHTGGLHDMYYGICAGRKGLLTKNMTFNTLSATEIAAWFSGKKAMTKVSL